MCRRPACFKQPFGSDLSCIFIRIWWSDGKYPFLPCKWIYVGGVKYKDIGFTKWYFEKCKRILFPTLITNVIYLWINYRSIEIDVLELFKIFVYPNKSWFCGAILFYGILYYFTAKCGKRVLYTSFAVVCVVYAAWYLTEIDYSIFCVESLAKGGLCRFAYYYGCMLVGLALYNREKQADSVPAKNSLRSFGLIGCSLVCFLMSMLYKIVIKTYETQMLVQLLTLAAAIFLFYGLRGLENRLQARSVCKIVEVIAAYSWEIYLVQTLIIPVCVKLLFPVNLIVCLLLICIASYVLKRICNSWLQIK